MNNNFYGLKVDDPKKKQGGKLINSVFLFFLKENGNSENGLVGLTALTFETKKLTRNGKCLVNEY